MIAWLEPTTVGSMDFVRDTYASASSAIGTKTSSSFSSRQISINATGTTTSSQSYFTNDATSGGNTEGSTTTSAATLRLRTSTTSTFTERTETTRTASPDFSAVWTTSESDESTFFTYSLQSRARITTSTGVSTITDKTTTTLNETVVANTYNTVYETDARLSNRNKQWLFLTSKSFCSDLSGASDGTAATSLATTSTRFTATPEITTAEVVGVLANNGVLTRTTITVSEITETATINAVDTQTGIGEDYTFYNRNVIPNSVVTFDEGPNNVAAFENKRIASSTTITYTVRASRTISHAGGETTSVTSWVTKPYLLTLWNASSQSYRTTAEYEITTVESVITLPNATTSSTESPITLSRTTTESVGTAVVTATITETIGSAGRTESLVGNSTLSRSDQYLKLDQGFSFQQVRLNAAGQQYDAGGSEFVPYENTPRDEFLLKEPDLVMNNNQGICSVYKPYGVISNSELKGYFTVDNTTISANNPFVFCAQASRFVFDGKEYWDGQGSEAWWGGRALWSLTNVATPDFTISSSSLTYTLTSFVSDQTTTTTSSTGISATGEASTALVATKTVLGGAPEQYATFRQSVPKSVYVQISGTVSQTVIAGGSVTTIGPNESLPTYILIPVPKASIGMFDDSPSLDSVVTSLEKYPVFSSGVSASLSATARN